MKIPNRRSLLWYIYSPLLLTILGVVVALCLLAISLLKSFYREQVITDLEALAELVGSQVLSSSAWKSSRQVEPSIKLLKNNPNIRINIYSDSGLEIYSSHQSNLKKSNQIKSEVRNALKGETAVSTRYLSEITDDMLFVALPIKEVDQPNLVVRVGMPLSQLYSNITKVWQRFLILGLAISILAGLIVWYLAKKVLNNISEIQKGAERMASGNLADRLDLPKQAELAKLAHAMNKMAHQLDERIKQVINQHNQLDTVLAGMTESVVAFDLDQRIIFMNSAAERLLGTNEKSAIKHFIPEIIRSVVAHELVDDLLHTHNANQTEFTYGDDNSQTIQARGSILYDNTGKVIGGLLVLNDVTELRRLERVRTDFVANVSHELRTPITSIKGFVETLLTNNVSTEDQQRFLQIISTHSNRLASIIEDLLTLSRLEQQHSTREVIKETTKISTILDTAINSCESFAKEKNITIERICREELRADIAPSLLEQAVINYIDNAIKYSEPNSSVRVEAKETDDEIIIAVHDNGSGISEEHHSRLFERFYRVDKARSRKVGGTGLGLSIVKHIAQTMGGYPTVSSELGRGSTFELHIPRG